MSLQRVTSVAAAAMIAGAVCAQDKPDLKDPKLRASYALGADIGSNLKRQELDLDAKALAAGISDAIGGKTALTPAEVQETLAELRKQYMAQMESKAKVAGSKNLKDGEDFLAANGKKDGVKTTASGLQYKVIKSGSGATPKPSDEVKVHYHGTLIDGTVFDSSRERGTASTLPLRGVIACWTEALQAMKVGGRSRIVCPPELAYGERGAPPIIKPGATLVFDIELLAIVH